MQRACLLIGIAVLVASPLARAEQGQIHLAISGEWKGAASDGTGISYSFTKEGAVVWNVDEKNFKQAFPEGLQGKYQFTPGKPFCEIDIYDFTHPQFKAVRFLGIVELIDSHTFKMEGMPSNRGERPKQFGKEAIIFRTSAK